MSGDPTTRARNLLRYLREEGFRIRSDGEKLLLSPASRLGDDLRGRVKDAKPDLLAALRREEVERIPDLVPVDPETGLPDLPADEPATMRQVERLRELADDPALSPHRERVREIVETALERELSQLGAFGLIGELGRRISRRRTDRTRTADVRCEGCGRRLGPTAKRCGRCRRADEALEEGG